MRISDWISAVCSSDLLIVDSSIQKIAGDALKPGASMPRAVESPASQQMLHDMLGRGTVPVFTRLDSERDDTSAVAYGRCHDLTDNSGLDSMVRSEERRVVKESVRTGRARWSPL